MRISNAIRLTTLGLTGLLMASASYAKDASTASGITAPESRTERFELLKLRDLLSTMQPSPGVKPAEEMLSAATSGGPSAPTRIDLARFGKFLRSAVKQSYNKSYRDAYNILKMSIDNARKIGPLPAGIDVCLVGARNGAAKADKWDDAWEILHTTAKAIGEDPQAYVGGDHSPIRNVLQLARKSTWDKTFKNATNTMFSFLEAIQDRSVLFENGYQRALVRAARSAGGSANKWDDAWRHMDRSTKVFAESVGEPRAQYIQAALNGSYDSSYRNSYKHLRAFADTLLAAGVCDPFDKITLETSVAASAAANQWTGAYNLLRDGFKSLQ